MWLPKARLYYLTLIFVLVLLAILSAMAEENMDTNANTDRNRERKRENRKRKGKKKDKEGRRRNKHKHKKQKEVFSSTTLPTVLSTLGALGLHQDRDSNIHGIAQPLVRDILDIYHPQNTSSDGFGERKKLRPSVMQREMKFTTVHGNRTWPMRELVSVVEGNITLGGLMMVHERDEEMICGKIMPQGGLQVTIHFHSFHSLFSIKKPSFYPDLAWISVRIKTEQDDRLGCICPHGQASMLLYRIKYLVLLSNYTYLHSH